MNRPYDIRWVRAYVRMTVITLIFVYLKNIKLIIRG